MNSYLIPSELLPALEKKVARINQRAKRLAQAPITLTKTGHTEERKVNLGGDLTRYMGIEYGYTVEEVIVEGHTPVIEGWTFVGIIKHLPAGKAAAQGLQSYVGSKGDKLTFTAKLTRQNTFETEYGFTTAYNFLDAQGNHYVWFSSRDLGLDTDETYTVKGTVKDHKIDRYTNNKQTVITRCKVTTQEAMPV